MNQTVTCSNLALPVLIVSQSVNADADTPSISITTLIPICMVNDGTINKIVGDR